MELPSRPRHLFGRRESGRSSEALLRQILQGRVTLPDLLHTFSVRTLMPLAPLLTPELKHMPALDGATHLQPRFGVTGIVEGTLML